MDIKQLIDDAMKLPVGERAELAKRLLFTLEDDAQAEGDSEEIWTKEAKRRLEELYSGKVEGIEGEEAFTKALKTLKE
jgi:putative addiction module component (TIGR02574 family)